MTQIGPEIWQHAICVSGYHLQCARNDDVPPKPETDSNLSQFSRSRVSTQPLLAQENFWVSQNSSKNFTATFQFVPKWIQIRQVTFSSEENREDSSTLNFDSWQYNKGISEKRLSVRSVDTKDNTTDLFTKFLVGPRTRPKEAWVVWDRRHGRLRSCERRFPVEQECNYSQFHQLTDCTVRRH